MQIGQTNLLLNVVIVFGGKARYEIFNGDTCIGLTLTFQLFQYLIVCLDIESVKDSPVEIESHIDCLVKYTVFFDRFSAFAYFGLRIVHRTFISG